jgi:cellulose synthase/poly-beta-1,6-N-acetylglucosamine synthase-like glycosyltransferase
MNRTCGEAPLPGQNRFPNRESIVIHCCVGIMAYNEEANIGRLLAALLSQKTRVASLDEIIVVASGCTDRTEEIVQEFAARDGRVRLLTQARKEGKASAVNLLLRHTECEVIILESADTLPLPETIEEIVLPLEDPAVGMVGGHPVPTNSRSTFMGYAAHLVWELHHKIALRHPKMGEIIAFRNVFHRIPHDTAVDEASIEPLIVGQGFQLCYAPRAVVYNRGPERAAEFVKQRRRVFAGHLYVKDTLGYQVSTMSSVRSAWALLRSARLDWRYLLWAPGVVALEAYVRLLATYDYVFRKRKPYNWSMATSTKQLVEVS